MFGDHAAYIIPSYAITALVLAGLFIWIKLTNKRHKKDIASFEEKGISRASSKKGARSK